LIVKVIISTALNRSEKNGNDREKDWLSLFCVFNTHSA
jgi:hypothetical protein